MGQGAVKAYVQGFFSDPSGAQGIADRSGKQAAGEIVRVLYISLKVNDSIVNEVYLDGQKVLMFDIAIGKALYF